MERREIEIVDGQDSRVVQTLTDCVGGLNAFVCVLLSCFCLSFTGCVQDTPTEYLS